MRISDFEKIMGAKASRRSVVKTTAGAAAAASAMGAGALGLNAMGLGSFVQGAAAQDGVRAQILAIPGIGTGQPTEDDMRRVGELCLESLKGNVAEGEFAGVELSFLGLNNQNLHNFVFRAFLASWEEYTGAKLTWIDLAQADYNARLQQSIATGTVDFDICEMGAPYEGDVLGKGLCSEMPDWVKEQIDVADYVGYLQAPVGTWDGKTYRVTIDGDCHNFNYRTDVFPDGPPTTWQEVNAFTQDPANKGNGYLDVAKPWGGFGWYFFASRATAYAKHPDDIAWLFDVDTMKPRINNPAFVRAIQDVIDCLPNEPADQINADGNTTGFAQFLAGTGSMCAWWGDVGSNAKTNDSSVVGDVTGFSILPGSPDVYNNGTGAWDMIEGNNFAPNMAYIGWGVYVMNTVDADAVRQKAAWSIAAHLGGKDISLWTAAYPSGFQPYRQTHFQIEEWVAAGYDEAFIKDYLDSEADSYNHPNAAIEPRIPGIFQYYSAAEEELAKAYAGEVDAQTAADSIAARWEEITDGIGRDSQIALYKASLGL